MSKTDIRMIIAREWYLIYSVVVPASARFEVNRLLVSGETLETAVADLERFIASLNLKSSVEVKIKPPKYEACVMDKDDPSSRPSTQYTGRSWGKRRSTNIPTESQTQIHSPVWARAPLYSPRPDPRDIRP